MNEKEKFSEEEYKLAEEVIKPIYHKAIQNNDSFAKYGVDCYLAGLKASGTEWHKIADGDLPEVDNRIVLCVCGNGYIDGKRNYILKLLTRKEFPLFQPVYVWKEIILPELPKESE